MSFGRILSLETAAAVVGSAIVTLLVDIGHISPYWLLLLVPMLGAILSVGFAREKLSVFRSGVIAYRAEFHVRDSRAYWEQAKREIVYWGVTGASIQEDLRIFLHEDRDRNVRYRFLLMSPTGDAIRQQIAFRRGFPAEGRSPDQEAIITAEVSVEMQRFQSTVAVLKATGPYTDRPCRLEIRAHDEFLPWWIYLVDDSLMIIGLLRSGQEVGDQPAAILKKTAVQVTLFESFHENLERVWRSSRLV